MIDVDMTDEIITINQTNCPYLKEKEAKKHLIRALNKAIVELKK